MNIRLAGRVNRNDFRKGRFTEFARLISLDMGRIMNKTILFIGLSLVSCSIHAGWLDDITTVVGGHFTDLQSRFMDDQLIDGDIIARTSFREGDRGQDMFHHGSGSVFVIITPEGRYIQLAPDFSSTPGPDYHVYISTDSNVDHEDRFVKDNQTELGRLIKGSGEPITRYLITQNFNQ